MKKKKKTVAKKKPTTMQLKRAAAWTKILNTIYTDADYLARAAADWWTTENLGMSFPEQNWRFEYVEAGVEDGMEEEYRGWLKDAKRFLKIVQRHKLPLTLRSMEQAFNRTIK